MSVISIYVCWKYIKDVASLGFVNVKRDSKFCFARAKICQTAASVESVQSYFIDVIYHTIYRNWNYLKLRLSQAWGINVLRGLIARFNWI